MASSEKAAIESAKVLSPEERAHYQKMLREKMAVQYSVMDAMVGPLSGFPLQEQNKRMADWSFRYGFLFAQAWKEDATFQDLTAAKNISAMASYLKAKAESVPPPLS